MKTKQIITEIRNKHNLTQDQFAARLSLTRQAISRWETGETSPPLHMLKKIAKLFQVDANYLLGITPTQICQSCAMALTSLDDLGTNSDESASTEFCTHCYQNGCFTCDCTKCKCENCDCENCKDCACTIDDMVESNLLHLDEFNAENNTNYTPDEAREILKSHLKTLKRWK